MSDESHHPYSTIFPTLILPDEMTGLADTIIPTSNHVHSTFSDLPLIDVCDTGSADFRITEELGRGGMGVVHLAEQRQLSRHVAIKTTLQNHAVSREALLLEGRIMGMVEHPNVVPVHSLGQDEVGRPWIIMKRIVGKPWDEVIRESTNLDRDLRVLSQVCQALAFAHQLGIMHRDIKPANVFVGDFGEVYLVDWGLALAIDDRHPNIPTINGANEIAGTPAYIAPEMTIGDGSKLGVFTDIYLVGAVLFQIITGEPPHLSKTLFDAMMSSYEGKERHYDAAVPGELKEICERAMALDPKDRYVQIRDLQNAIAFYLEHRSSMDLTHVAVALIPRLETLIRDGTKDSHPALFNEIKFSLRSAINIWSENKLAFEAHDRILTIMIEHELSEDNPAAANTFLSELGQKNAGLELRVNEAMIGHTKRAEKFVELEKLEYDLNANVGARQRLVPLMIIAIGSLSVLPIPYLHAQFSISIGALFLIHTFAISAIIFPCFYYFLKTSPVNFANRVFIKGTSLVWLETVLLRIIVWLNHAPLKLVLAFELILFSVACVQTMLAIDRRMVVPALIFALGAVAVFAFDPIYTYAFVGLLANGLTAASMRYTRTETFSHFQNQLREKFKIGNK